MIKISNLIIENEKPSRFEELRECKSLQCKNIFKIKKKNKHILYCQNCRRNGDSRRHYYDIRKTIICSLNLDLNIVRFNQKNHISISLKHNIEIKTFKNKRYEENEDDIIKYFEECKHLIDKDIILIKNKLNIIRNKKNNG